MILQAITCNTLLQLFRVDIIIKGKSIDKFFNLLQLPNQPGLALSLSYDVKAHGREIKEETKGEVVEFY